MKVQFSCRCGVSLRCTIRRIGSTKICPACSSTVIIPSPSEETILKAMGTVLHVMPGGSPQCYRDDAVRIARKAYVVFELGSRTGHELEVSEWLKESVRQLRNLSVFYQDAVKEPPVRPVQSVSLVPLASVAAGPSFAGYGGRKRKLRSYRRWLKNQIHEQRRSSNTDVQAMPSFVRQLISHLDELRAEL